MRIISEIKKTEFIPKNNANQFNSQNNKGNVSTNNVENVEKIEISPIKNGERTGISNQKEQIKYEESLRQYGIRDYDIARLQNGEITIENLMKEIDKDPDRKRDVLESQGLLNSITNLENAGYRINQKVYNLDELDNYIEKLESEINEYTNGLHNDEELNALAKIIKFLENGVDLDSALISGTVAYMYKDANGEKHYVYEQPIGSMMNDQINAGKHYIIGSDGRTYESLNYKEMYGESEYIKELRNNLTKGNSNFFEKTFLNQNDEVYKYDKSSDQSKYIESLKEIISNSQKESDELEAKIYELTEELETCKYVSTNVKEEVDYFMDNINPYVMQDDFLANNNFNNSSTKIVDDLKAKYYFSSSSGPINIVSNPTINISDQKEKVDIISCILNGKGNISNGFLMAGNCMFELESSDDIISHYANWSKLMSDNEIEIFNYIYNTDTSANKDKAYQYLKDISKELDNRWLQNRTKEDEDFAGNHHTLASIGSVVVTPVEGMSALCYSLKEYINEKLHPEDPTAQIYRTDVYSSGDVWRSKVARDIAETKGDLASFIYSTGMSMADSVSLIALSAATGGVATPALSASLMGSRAYVSTLNDSLDRGLSDGQAVLLAASSAVFETAMESYSVGHLMNLEGHLSKEAIEIGKDIAKDISNPQVANIVTKGFYVIANSVCQGVAEGEEELATEVLNYVSDIFVSKDSSQFCESIQYYLDNGYTEDEALYATLNNFKGQLTQAFAGGFASGLCFGGFSGINSTINTSYGISQDLYTNLQGDTKAQQFANALEINQQQLKELEAAAKKKGENLTQSEIELLQNGTIEQQAADALKNKIFSKNLTDVNIEEINKTREYNQENGFQVTEADFGPLYSFYAKSGFFSKEQTKNMIENINNQGYISEDVGSYLDTLFDGESDIYIKTVHSNDVDSIFREGIRCMGNTTSGFGEVPTSIENVELENTVTKLDGLFELVTRIKNAKGISQGGNPIDGTLIIKVPKGTNLKDSLVWNNQTKTFNINPDTISSFMPLNNEEAVGLKLNKVIAPLSEQEIESFIDEYLKDPTTTIPKGISNELVEYLVKYSHNPNATIPMSVPNEIIEYIKSKSTPQTVDSYYDVDVSNMNYDESLPNNIKIKIMIRDNIIYDKNLVINEFNKMITKVSKDDYNLIFNDLFTLYFRNISANLTPEEVNKTYSYETCNKIYLNSLYRIITENIDITEEQFRKLLSMIKIKGPKIENYINNYLENHKKINLSGALDSIQYNANTPKNLKKQIIYQILSEYDNFILKNSSDVYGSDQNAVFKYIQIRCNNLNWLTNKSDFINYLISKRKYSKKNAKKLLQELKSTKGSFTIKLLHKLKPTKELFTINNASTGNIILEYIFDKCARENRFDVLDILNQSFSLQYNSEIKRLGNKLMNQGMSYEEALRTLCAIDSTGCCSYASIVNAILLSYKNSPQAFENDFGYPLYVNIDGKQEFNAAELLLDMYIYINSNNFSNKNVKGKMFNFDQDGLLHVNELNTESQLFLSGYTWHGVDAINSFLASKNSSLNYKLEKRFLFGKENITATKENVRKIKEKIINYLKQNANNTVELGIYYNEEKKYFFFDKVIPFRLMTIPGKVYTTTETWNEGGGHAVCITGVLDDYFIVSSWGERLLIPIEDFINNKFNVIFRNVEGIK